MERVTALILSNDPAVIEFLRDNDDRFARAPVIAGRASVDEVADCLIGGRDIPLHLAASAAEAVVVDKGWEVTRYKVRVATPLPPTPKGGWTLKTATDALCDGWPMEEIAQVAGWEVEYSRNIGYLKPRPALWRGEPNDGDWEYGEELGAHPTPESAAKCFAERHGTKVVTVWCPSLMDDGDEVSGTMWDVDVETGEVTEL